MHFAQDVAPIVNMLQRAGNRAIAVALTTIVSFALLAGLLYVVANHSSSA